ncbi:MAG: hypothetical protein M1325_00415, partial [Actinobacteria bacterium]|nr:hypothetical protein [Actinomycetota bacterium]
MATGLVAAGMHEHVLVVGAEAISRILDWNDRGTAVLFGDAAGAVVVSPADGAGRILGFDLGNDGAGADLLSIPAGGSRLPASHETVDGRRHYLHMNGREVYRFATRIIGDSATRVLEQCGRRIDEIDLFVPHQANMRIRRSYHAEAARLLKQLHELKSLPSLPGVGYSEEIQKIEAQLEGLRERKDSS